MLNAGDLFAIAPHEIHWYDYNPGADVAFYNIYLSPVAFAEIQQRLHNNCGFNTPPMQNAFYRHAHGFQALHVEGREFASWKRCARKRRWNTKTCARAQP